MKITRVVKGSDKSLEDGPNESRQFARFSEGVGCGAPFCNCSPGVYWLTIFDGEIGLTIHFDNEEEYNEFREDSAVYGLVPTSWERAGNTWWGDTETIVAVLPS